MSDRVVICADCDLSLDQDDAQFYEYEGYVEFTCKGCTIFRNLNAAKHSSLKRGMEIAEEKLKEHERRAAQLKFNRDADKHD